MNEKICPECDAVNPASEDICDECGFPLEDGASASPSAATKASAPTCPGCGKNVSAGMRFCDGCGHRLEAEPQPDTVTVEPVPEPPPLPPVGAKRDETEPDSDSVLESGTPQSETPQSGAPQSGAPQPAAPQPVAPRLATISPGDRWKLSVVEGFSIGKEYLLFGEEMMIGRMDREAANYPDIDLEDQDDGFVSRKHALVRVTEGQVTIEDLGGENGTTVDRQPIPPFKQTPLAEGQVVRLGKVALMLKIHHKK